MPGVIPQYDVTLPVTAYKQMQSGAIQPDFNGVAINWFPNRTPIGIRLPKRGLGSTTFVTFSDNFRASSQLMANAGTLANNGTSLTVTDGSQYTAGDIVEIEAEQIRVTSVAANVLTITRGFGGTSAVSHVDLQPIYTIGRATSGAEVGTTGMSRLPVPTTQYAHTVQHTYNIGGSVASIENYFAAYGTPLDRDRMMAMQNVVDDRERALIYGAAQAYTASGTVQQMAGFRNLCVTNKTVSPTNASAYKPADLLRDTIQKCYDGGGNPTVLFASTDFLSGLATWGIPQQRLEAGKTIYGVPITTLAIPFLGNIDFIPCPLMRPGSVLCLSASEACIREKRVLFEKPRGSRGDAIEGDFIWEGAPELDNEAHHAWVSGITAFSAP